MIFSFNPPKSQTFRAAQFEAIQLAKNIATHNNYTKLDINNLTKKIYNSGIVTNKKMNMSNFFIKKPTPTIKFTPTSIPNTPTPNNNEETSTSKKILVLFIYHIFNERVKHFINNCIFYDDNVDFIIISNTNVENNNVLNISNQNNVKILYRNNVGYDFGGWSDALLKDNLYENYDYFIFANSSIIGPFFKPSFKGKWTDIYVNGLQNNVKLFGSTINTMGDPLKSAHVQSYIFSIDKITLKYLIDCSIFSTTNYAKTFHNAIFDKEVLMSRKIIENNWNIGSLMKYYENVDFTFRHKKPKDYSIKFLDDVMYQKYRFEIWNEYEIVFVKGNRIEINY
jgi:hypothetical protein